MINDNTHADRVRRIHLQRIINKETALSPNEEKELLEQLSEVSFETMLDILRAHGTLGRPELFIERLVTNIDRWAVPFFEDWILPIVVTRFDADSYAAFVERAAKALVASDSERARLTLSFILRPLQGGPRFQRVRDAGGFGVPTSDGIPIALRLLERDVRHDDAGVLRVVVEESQKGLESAYRIWKLTWRCGDPELEGAVREQFLAQLVSAEAVSPRAEEHQFLWTEVVRWVDHAGSEDGERRRGKTVRPYLERLRASGVPYRAMHGRIPRVLQRWAIEQSIEDGQPMFGAVPVLQERLEQGEPSAWERLFRWLDGENPSPELYLPNFLREGRLPEQPDDAFWQRYADMWNSAQRIERENFDHLASTLPPGLDRHEREWRLKQLYPQSLPRLVPALLIERILDRPPCAASARLLVRALREAPGRIVDPRIVEFSRFFSELPHELLPGIDLFRIDDSDAMAGFLALHPHCGAEHLRQASRAQLSNEPRAYGPQWLIRQKWLPKVLDDALREEIRRALLALRLAELVHVAVAYPDWISPEDAIDEARRRPDERLPIARRDTLPAELRTPEWLHPVLLERVRATTDIRLIRDVWLCGDAAVRGPLASIMFEKLIGEAIPQLAGMAGEALSTPNAWDKKGHQLVHALIQQQREGEILELIRGDYSLESASKSEGDPEKKLVVAMHSALARGILRWAEERAQAQAHDDVDRALAAMALLDPPKWFLPELRKFEKLSAIDERARHWVQRIQQVQRAGGGEDASMNALYECARELIRTR